MNHVIDDGLPSNETTIEAANSTSCAFRPTEVQTLVITVAPSCSVQVPPSTVTSSRRVSIGITSTITEISSITVTATPQSSCSCSGQQQTSTSSSSSDSDVVTVVVPIVVVMGVIIVILLIVIGILVWRKTEAKSQSLPYDKVTRTTTVVENDLYGLVYIS